MMMKMFGIFCFMILYSLQSVQADVKTAVYVSQQNGDDDYPGLSESQPVATIQKGIDVLKQNGADVLIVGPGTYYERPQLYSIGSSENKKVWIVAEPRGEAVISGMWKAAAEGNVQWTDQGSNIWSARHAASFVGSCKGYFLFHYNNFEELTAASVMDVKKPPYGFTTKSGYLYLQLPEGENPNTMPVKLTDNFGGAIIDIKQSPYLILDGFVIEGGGRGGSEGAAINADQESHHLLYRNLIFRYCRRCVQMPDHSTAEWCEYTYPNFYNFAEDLRVLNDGIINVVYTLVKKVFSDNGNAYYEGAFAVSFSDRPSENVEVHHCYFHETFDAENLGQFNHSSTHHNVYNYNYDDNNELECWKRETHHGVDLRVHDNLMLNCMAGPMSHQDVGGSTLYGPHYVYRNVIYITDPDHSHPAFVIKNKNGHESLNIYYYHNILMNVQGSNAGWGTTNWLFWNNQNRDALHFYNNILLLDNCTNTDISPPVNTNHNILVNNKDMPWLRGEQGQYAGSDDRRLLFRDVENLNFAIGSGSLAENTGAELPEGWPDSEHAVQGLPDIGPFEVGEEPGNEWPRPLRTVFNETPPEGFEEVNLSQVRPDVPSPSQVLLYHNYPNPFNAMTQIPFQLAENTPVNIRIYDLQGRVVDSWKASEVSAGHHVFAWNAAHQPSGSYFIRLEAGKQQKTNKCLLIN